VERWDWQGVVRSTAVAVGASGVEGAAQLSFSVFISSSLQEESGDIVLSDGVGASGRGGLIGLARHSLKKALC